MFDISTQYYLVFKNINSIKNDLLMVGESLTSMDLYYIKRIILYRKKGWFNYKGFNKMCNMDITRQGSLKILNRLLKLNILISKMSNKNEKIFLLNDKKINFQIE